MILVDNLTETHVNQGLWEYAIPTFNYVVKYDLSNKECVEFEHNRSLINHDVTTKRQCLSFQLEPILQMISECNAIMRTL